MTPPPLVSICIPSFNHAQFIGQTIRSILDQTYTYLEVIVCDDCSTDTTVEIASQINDPRVKIYRNDQNLGITGNWNRSVSLATGKYVKLVCGDDLLDPECITRQVDAMEKDFYQNISLVSTGVKLVNQNGNLIMKKKISLSAGINNADKIYKLCALKGTNVIGEPMCGLFRRNVLDQGIRYNGENPYMIDLDFWFKLLTLGNLYCINEHLCSFRISKKSLSASLSIRQPLLFQKFIREAGKIYNIPTFYIVVAHISSSIMGILRNIVFRFF